MRRFALAALLICAASSFLPVRASALGVQIDYIVNNGTFNGDHLNGGITGGSFSVFYSNATSTTYHNGTFGSAWLLSFQLTGTFGSFTLLTPTLWWGYLGANPFFSGPDGARVMNFVGTGTPLMKVRSGGITRYAAGFFPVVSANNVFNTRPPGSVSGVFYSANPGTPGTLFAYHTFTAQEVNFVPEPSSGSLLGLSLLSLALYPRWRRMRRTS